MEGPIFGGAYSRWKICFTNSIGLACSWKGNKNDWVTMLFSFCSILQFPSSSPCGLIFRGAI